MLTCIPSFVPMIFVAACFMDAPAALAYYRVTMLPPTHPLLACYKLMVYPLVHDLWISGASRLNGCTSKLKADAPSAKCLD